MVWPRALVWAHARGHAREMREVVLSLLMATEQTRWAEGRSSWGGEEDDGAAPVMVVHRRAAAPSGRVGDESGRASVVVAANSTPSLLPAKQSHPRKGVAGAFIVTPPRTTPSPCS